jgi:hypothetical protein
MRSRCCLCVCVCEWVSPPIVARKRLGKSSLVGARQRLGNILSLLGNGSVKFTHRC